MTQRLKNLPLFFFFLSILLFACKQNVMKKSNPAKTKALNIKPSATSSENDFDFLEGKWKVKNRKLKLRLSNSNAWFEFESALNMQKTLNGIGNVENYYATFDGKPFEGMAIRLFNPATKLWTVYWIDSNGGVMDEHPVTGSFKNGLGKFYARDIYRDKDIIVLYQWDATNAGQPKWGQAFSEDNGKTWEWNWKMILARIE